MRHRLFCRYTHFNFSAFFLSLFNVFIHIHKFVNQICISDYCVVLKSYDSTSIWYQFRKSRIVSS